MADKGTETELPLSETTDGAAQAAATSAGAGAGGASPAPSVSTDQPPTTRRERTRTPRADRPPRKPRTRTRRPAPKLAPRIATVYVTAGAVASFRLPQTGQSVQACADAAGTAWEQLAEQYPAVRVFWERVLSTSAAGALLMAHLPILAAAVLELGIVTGPQAEQLGMLLPFLIPPPAGKADPARDTPAAA